MLCSPSMLNKPKIAKKYQPPGFDIIHEDVDLIIGNKSADVLTVAALWEKTKTVHQSLNTYVQKGNPRSNKCVYVVHRLDQATSGLLVFAKTEKVQFFLKDNWKTTVKMYYAIVHGKFEKKSGLIESYLVEDEDYVMHSTDDAEKGKLAKTEYTVVFETAFFSVVKINLLTGKKNQIRVHMSDAGHPIVGDLKYGKEKSTKHKNLLLHAFSISFMHPHNQKIIRAQADVPDYFYDTVQYDY